MPFWPERVEIRPKNFFVVISRVSDIYGPILGGDLEDQKKSTPYLTPLLVVTQSRKNLKMTLGRLT